MTEESYAKGDEILKAIHTLKREREVWEAAESVRNIDLNISSTRFASLTPPVIEFASIRKTAMAHLSEQINELEHIFKKL